MCVSLKFNGGLLLGHAVLKVYFILLLYFLTILYTMSGRQSNKLPSNLPQLQNLIKRDPQSYVDEVSVVSLATEAVRLINVIAGVLRFDELLVFSSVLQ